LISNWIKWQKNAVNSLYFINKAISSESMDFHKYTKHPSKWYRSYNNLFADMKWQFLTT
jgi:hypothetical protein